MKKPLFYLSLLGAVLAPSFAFAADDLSGVLATVGGLLSQIIPLFISLAVVFFIFGMLKFILNAGSPEGRKAGFNTMLMGILVLFVMVSFWGIVGMLQTTFGIGTETAQVPGLASVGQLIP
ncbi:MAG TPA: hypothetical protein VFM02_02070 [Candidatus Paceibacterota bacterium]|nr:hypothetical protein [Candidatus Paceibacterota bacterium]